MSYVNRKRLRAAVKQELGEQLQPAIDRSYAKHAKDSKKWTFREWLSFSIATVLSLLGIGIAVKIANDVEEATAPRPEIEAKVSSAGGVFSFDENGNLQSQSTNHVQILRLANLGRTTDTLYPVVEDGIQWVTYDPGNGSMVFKGAVTIPGGEVRYVVVDAPKVDLAFQFESIYGDRVKMDLSGPSDSGEQTGLDNAEEEIMAALGAKCAPSLDESRCWELE